MDEEHQNIETMRLAINNKLSVKSIQKQKSHIFKSLTTFLKSDEYFIRALKFFAKNVLLNTCLLFFFRNPTESVTI